jgi:hypothetical protein
VRHVQRRRALPVAAAALLAAGGVAAAIAATGGSSGTKAPPPRIAPVARSADAAQQARNLVAWVERYSAKP